MKRRLFMMIRVSSFLTQTFSQAQSNELEKLARFLGRWKTEGTFTLDSVRA